MLPYLDTSELDSDPYWLVVILRREGHRFTRAQWLQAQHSFTRSYHDSASPWYRKVWAANALAFIADQLNQQQPRAKLNSI